MKGPGPSWICRTMRSVMAPDEIQIPLEEQLAEIGAQLDWVRGYL